MSARIIDGQAVAAEIRAEVAAEVARLGRDSDLRPGLAVVLVGDDPASQVYVRNKGRQTTDAGMRSFEFKLPASTPEADVVALVRKLNADEAVDGILVQMPLPKPIEARNVIEAIDPAKDVDGLTVANAGRLQLGLPALVPCTPQGCLILLDRTLKSLAGASAVVVGRSVLVGKPMAALLLARDCTVTVAHSKTRDLPSVCREADIVIAAVGRARMLKGDWLKPGATVIDVGINRIEGADGKARLVGDVAFDEASLVAGAITPVPKGVGPMTIACLLRNTVEAAKRRRGIAVD
jgi:methylenetetrahydrofolate dehydrogenase (NADP+)/methenyltetrahydrofolate cyclohydrolase